MEEYEGPKPVEVVSSRTQSIRRHDIDWLRVILFGLLIWFHYAVFSLGQLEGLSNGVEGRHLVILMVLAVMHQWRLAALFVISGMGTAFAFRSKSWGDYLRERGFRLGVPLLFFTYIISAGITEPIDTTRRLMTPFPGIDEMPYGHLWFVFNLLIYSIVLTPVFSRVSKDPEMGIMSLTRTLLNAPRGLGILVMPALILALNGFLLKPWAFGEVGMNWEFSRYLLFFLFGFLMISAKEEYFDSLETVRVPVTVMTPALSLVWFLSSESFGVPGVMEGGWVTEGHPAFSTATAVASLLQSFHAWFWCLLIFSWASRLLNKPNRWLPYLNQSVYPAYILHMTPTWILIVILSILGTNYYIGLVIGTLVVTGVVLFLFEFIRRASAFRMVFGVKGGPREVSKIWPYTLTRDRGTQIALSVFFNILVFGLTGLLFLLGIAS